MNATATATQPLTGGPLVIDTLMRRSLNRNLTAAQAKVLWEQCKARLNGMGLGETVEEAEESGAGRLDTLPRGDVMSVIGMELAGMDWPLNASSQDYSEAFLAAIQASFLTRDYVRVLT